MTVVDGYNDFLPKAKRMFDARLGFFGELVQKIELSCSYNFHNNSCSWVNQQIVAITRVCLDYRATDINVGSIFYTLPENPLSDSGMQICKECRETVRDIMQEGHCCVSTALLLKKQLLDLFLPGPATSLALDLADYQCIVHSKCDQTATGSAGEGNLVTLSKGASICHGTSAPNLECVSEHCDLGYEWPVSCCKWLNRGSRLYEGACWCQCEEPFTGNHCED